MFYLKMTLYVFINLLKTGFCFQSWIDSAAEIYVFMLYPGILTFNPWHM